MINYMSRITENSWDCLLTQIDKGNVVLILGNGLYFIKDEDGDLIPIEEYIQKEMCTDLGIEYDDSIDLDRLCDPKMRLLWEDMDSSPYYWTYKRLTRLKNENKIVAPDIERILSLKKFDIVITTAVTDIAFNIMQKQYGDIYIKSLQYEKGSNKPDLPPESTNPFFYQMFGNICPIDYRFVLSEDDLLSFMHNWLDKGRHPENMVNHIGGKYILAIGCNYPNWLFRFFFHSIKENCGERGKTGIVINSQLDRDLTRFLSRKKMDTYDDAHHFIEELVGRWESFHGTQTTAEDREIFISYASEDYTKAKKIAAMFEGNGWKVWFDKRSLISGEDYEKVIRSHISNCEGFIPILSSNTIPDGSRFYEKEWSWAFDLAEKRNTPSESFIFPIMVDTLEYSSIPAAFRDIHISDFSNPDTDKETQIQRIRRRINKTAGYGI